MIINDNHISFQKYNINNTDMKVIFVHTYPFDSIFESLTTAYVKSSAFKMGIDNAKILMKRHFLLL